MLFRSKSWPMWATSWPTWDQVLGRRGPTLGAAQGQLQSLIGCVAAVLRIVEQMKDAPDGVHSSFFLFRARDGVCRVDGRAPRGVGGRAGGRARGQATGGRTCGRTGGRAGCNAKLREE